MAGDQQIVTADGQSPARQARLDLGGVVSRGVIEWQHFEPSGEALHLISILFRSRGFSRAVEKFGEDYRGNAEAVSFEIKPLAYLLRPISQHPDAKVGVEQEAKHLEQFTPLDFGLFPLPKIQPRRVEEIISNRTAGAMNAAVLLIHGDADFVRLSQAQEMFTALARQHARHP